MHKHPGRLLLLTGIVLPLSLASAHAAEPIKPLAPATHIAPNQAQATNFNQINKFRKLKPIPPLKFPPIMPSGKATEPVGNKKTSKTMWIFDRSAANH